MENTLNPQNRKMSVQKMLQGSKKPELTIKRLGEMLIEYINNPQEETVESRLLQPKRQIINYLFNYIGCISEAQLQEMLSSAPLDKEDNLIFYTYFLSQTYQFNFEWSYIISKARKIPDFLKRFNKYINFVCSDINTIIASIQLSDQIHFQVDEFLRIIYSPTQNSLTAQCKLDLLKNIISCKSDQYRLKIICDSKTIISIDRSSREEDLKAVTDKIQTMLTFSHNNYSKEGKHDEE